MGHPKETPPRLPKPCPAAPPTPPAVPGLRANFHPRPSAQRAPRRLEMKFGGPSPRPRNKWDGEDTKQTPSSATEASSGGMLPRHPPPHTPPFSQLSPGSPRSQPAPTGSFRANPYGIAVSLGAHGESGGSLRGGGGGLSHPPPGLHNRSPAGAERTHGHYLSDPAAFRSDPRLSSR